MSLLAPLDGCSSNIVFCIWSDSNQMSDDRLRALFSIFYNVGRPIAFLNHQSIKNWERPEAPFHPAFEFLSSTHKSDYLRTYLMHHYGGGYTDIKLTHKNWTPYFERLNASQSWALGYQEIGPHGVAPVGGEMESQLKDNYQSLIGLCSFIFKKKTPITSDWITAMHDLLDLKFEDLKNNPAKFPQDQQGLALPDGSRSAYPIKWTELLGNIFHPLILKYKDHILQDDLAPIFHSYR